jgi:uncharacterized protein (TIGR02118 family)
MIKLTFSARRLPSLSQEEFRRYWLDMHAPLANVLCIKRYIQLHPEFERLSEAIRKSRGAREPYDGVAELWFESPDDLRVAAATPEGRAAGAELIEDEKRFIDHGRSSLWFGSERLIIG